MQDKIKHQLIIVNQLARAKEEIKYIIAHLFAATKLMFEASKQQKIDTLLIHRVITRYEQLYCQYSEQFPLLDQIHQYMIEEINILLNSQDFKSRSKIKKAAVLSSNNLLLSSKYIPKEEQIIIPQQTYHFMTSQSSEVSIQLQLEKDKETQKYCPVTSLEAIPSFLHKHQECQQMKVTAEKFYQDHKIDEAYDLCQKYKNKLILAQPNHQLKPQTKQFLQKINSEYELMTYYYQFFDQPGYIIDKEDRNVKMFYKINEQKKQVSVKVEAELEISIQVFVSIVSQIDLFQQYIPFSYDTKLLKSISRNQKIGTTKVWLPLLDDREAYFYAAAYDRLTTHNSIFFYSKTISSDSNFQTKIGFKVTKNPDYVQLEYRFYILQYIPVSTTRGKIRLATNVNMGLNFLPLFVINKSCRIFAFDYFKNIMDVNKKFKGSLWEKKMKQNPELYDFFRCKIQLYLNQIK